MSMATRQRRERILTEVADRKHLSIKDLATAVMVSEATVRRDLKVLADMGQVEVVHGDVSLARNSSFSFRSKAQRNVEAKRTIGRLAAELVSDDEQVFLDSGTTCFEMLPPLKRKHGLSIIANSSRVAMEWDRPGSIIMLGGQYRPDRMDTVGPLAASSLEQLRGYLAFIGADGVSMDVGVMASDIDSAHIYRLAIQNARETILLIDHTKFLAPSLFKITGWEALSRLVTDQPPPPQWAEFLQARGIKVLCPDHAPVASNA
ncbi:MAG: DeoR/GlpR family DNA-binding transcription regulator [Planctomycetota bacterium]|nr:DeoR/GlpR family DNA-binding transcription regulator [Planctomycetota bacterium]